MSGLFAHRGHNQGRPFVQWRAQKRIERARDVERFAECLANSGTATNAVAACAAAQGKTVGWGESILREVRKALGWELTK